MPRYMLSKKSLAAVVLAFACLAAGCAGNQADSATELAANHHPEPWSLELALPSDALKSASLEDADRFCYGADYISELPNQRVTAQGTELALKPTWDAGGQPSPDDLAYAMYVFSLDGYDDLPQLVMNWSEPPMDWTSCFIGLGNQQYSRWDWFTGEEVSGSGLTLEDIAPYLDGDGGLVMITLLTGLDECTLKWLRWGGDVAPIAALEANPLSGSAPLAVMFNASSSFDPDGALSDFEWDFDGDGNFSETGPEADARSSPLAYFTYNNGGIYFAAVQVSDSYGAKDTATQQITAQGAGGWVQVTLDGMYGTQISLAVINGCPAISYLDTQDDKVKYARASTATGANASDWSPPVPVDDNNPYGGGDTSLAEIEGQPAIAYNGWLAPDLLVLRYVRSTSSTGKDAGDWSKFITVDDWDGQYLPSLAVVDGNPAIAYFSGAEGTGVYYLRSTTSTGISEGDWNSRIQIDYATPGFRAPAFAVVNGNPATTYADWADYHVKYVRATTSTGADAEDWSHVIDIGEGIRGWASLDVVAERPAIGLVDIDANVLYARATTSTGADAADWSGYITLEGVTAQTTRPVLLLAYGQPLIAFRDRGTEDRSFVYVHSTTDTGEDPSDWGEVVAVGTAVNPGSAGSVVNGNPAFCFPDYSIHTLRYAYYDP